MIKSTGVLMTEEAANALAYPAMVCPITSKPFKMSDIVEVQRSGTGYVGSGSQVQVSVYRPNLN